MAKANTELQKEQEAGLPAVIDFAADAGLGMETAGADAFAIPFLAVIQKGSPQVDEQDSKYLPDAKPGMLLNSVTKSLFDGKIGVQIVPCAYRRVFVRWAPRDGGGGYRGEFTPEEVAAMRARKEIVEYEGKLYAPLEDGSVSPKRCDRFADTRNHYVLVMSVDGPVQALLSLTSTQIKKSKELMSLMAGVKVHTQTGKVTPPTFANFVRITTVPESNDQGSWYGVKFEMQGQVVDAAVYELGKEFHASVTKGTVTAAYTEEIESGAEKF